MLLVSLFETALAAKSAPVEIADPGNVKPITYTCPRGCSCICELPPPPPTKSPFEFESRNAKMAAADTGKVDSAIAEPRIKYTCPLQANCFCHCSGPPTKPPPPPTKFVPIEMEV